MELLYNLFDSRQFYTKHEEGTIIVNGANE